MNFVKTYLSFLFLYNNKTKMAESVVIDINSIKSEENFNEKKKFYKSI